MFPILDVSSHHVGFGGRLLRDGEPKYLNSSDSPVFSKGRLLYGLNYARNNIRRENKAVLVEGYFDVVRLVEFGIENVVAPLGTALTDEQVALLGRYTRNVVLLYDSDAAGLKATFRAGDALLAQGFSVQVASLPTGEDPDSFALRRGRDGLQELLSDTLDVFERKLRLLEQKGWLRDISGKRRAIDKLVLTVRATADPITRDLYISRAAEATGVPRTTLLDEVAAEKGPRRVSGARNTEGPGATLNSPRATAEIASTKPTVHSRRRPVHGESNERAILAAIMQAPALLHSIAERIGPDDFWVPEHRTIFEELVEAEDELTVPLIEKKLSADVIPYFQAVIEYGESLVEVQRTLDDSLKGMESRALERRRREIDRQMPLATTKEEGDDLLREKDRLARPGGGTWAAVRAKQ
jgi:DNA primase